MLGLFRSLWAYRHFVVNSVWNDFYARFVRSRLGGTWVILHPLSQVMIYAFILSSLMSSRLPGLEGRYGYAIYLMSGLLAWNLFSEIVDRCAKVFITHADAIKKVHFPRVTLPVIAILSAVFTNLVLFMVMSVIFLLLGHIPGINIVYVAVVMPVIVVFAAGIGLLMGVLNVFFRDIEQALPIGLQLLFWLTPIVYPIAIIPEQYAGILALSPLFWLVEAYHAAIAYDQAPALAPIAAIAIMGAVLCALALFMFRKANADMVDVL